MDDSKRVPDPIEPQKRPSAVNMAKKIYEAGSKEQERRMVERRLRKVRHYMARESTPQTSTNAKKTV